MARTPGSGCKLCAASNRAIIDAVVRAGGRYSEIRAVALVDLPQVAEQTILNHKTHVGRIEDDEQFVAVETAKEALTKEMEGQPAVIKAQYAIAIALLDDVKAPNRAPDAKGAIAALRAINEAKGNAAQQDSMKAFMAGAATAATLAAERVRELSAPASTEVTVGPPEG